MTQAQHCTELRNAVLDYPQPDGLPVRTSVGAPILLFGSFRRSGNGRTDGPRLSRGLERGPLFLNDTVALTFG